MDELTLNQDLYYNVAEWMKPRYSVTTQRQRLYFLRKLSKQYNVLNKQTLIEMFKGFKYQHQKASIIMLNEYCMENNIDFNLHIPKLKRKREEKFPELLSIAEIERMIESTPYPYSLAIRCIFNFGAGLRISEIIKFSWNHIRWIDWLKEQDNYGVATIKAGKGSKDRTINIPKKLMHDLYEYAKQKQVLDEFRVPKGGMIFDFSSNRENEKEKEIKEGLMKQEETAKADYVLTRYNWFRYNILQKYCEKALGKKIKIHSLRHSRSTYLYEYEHVPIERIQQLLGHSSINTTMLYTKIKPLSTFELLKNTKEI
jgi:integrase